MISRNTLQLLEYDRLLEIISESAHSSITKKRVLDISPMKSEEDIRDRFSLVEDIRTLSAQGVPLGIEIFDDIYPLLERVRPKGAVLEAKEISRFLPVLDMARDITLQIREAEGLKSLTAFVSALTGLPDLLAAIKRAIDTEGNIKDSASPALAGIRRDLRRLEGSIQKKLEEMTRDESMSVFLQDDFITRRAGRWVVPVRMDSKGMVPGVVHDVSKSGETAFIEPLGVIHISNELENLAAEEKAEELRILRMLSSLLREHSEDAAAEFNIIVGLDLLNCIAVSADSLGCETPELSESCSIRLVSARHPLLFLSFRKSGRHERIVPLDLELGGRENVMVITGSNAGGKTISIKTVGLLLCMALSGIPVPASSLSRFPVVSTLLADMGDEQSIENSLSTFSAHITNITKILETADSRTIVLIDELGTGTDPDEGSALSCAVLKELQQKGSLVFATTHLVGIKGYVHSASGMANASMEFDKKTLSPLYRLRTGEPGQSHALEIALKYGMPASVVNSARELLGGHNAELDDLIADLREKRGEQERLIADLKKMQSDTETNQKLIEQKLGEAEAAKKQTLAAAHKEALEIVTEMKRQMRLELDAVKKKEKTELQDKIREMEKIQKQITGTLSLYDTEDGGAPGIDDLHVGDTVYLKSLGYDGQISGIISKANRVKVVSGTKEVLVPVSDIRLKKGKSPAEKGRKNVMKEPDDELVPSKINLIGMRVDEALPELEPFINHAALAGYREITVIHGFGTGALAKAVRGYLKTHALVAGFRYGESAEGGGGVTVVTLK